MFRKRPAPRHRGDPRRHGGLGEQLVICVVSVQISLAWLPSTQAEPAEVSQQTPRAPAVFGPPAIPIAAQFAPPVVVDAEIPASVTTLTRAEKPREPAAVVQTASTNGIPDAALAAYQRAAAVLGSADPTCRLDWQLIAAIGRVESNHGRYGGNVVTTDGRSRPGIFGIALNGERNTAVIRDTDAGLYDRDVVYDRAVGPMQFIPSTWSVVGVDADGDGERDPQDIDDAALAAAVYLCSGDGDLSVAADERQAVFRYNHSGSYVDLVVAIKGSDLEGDFAAVPTSVRVREIDEPIVVEEETDASEEAKPDDETTLEIAAEVMDHLDATWPPRGQGNHANPGHGPGSPGHGPAPECASDVTDAGNQDATTDTEDTAAEPPEYESGTGADAGAEGDVEEERPLPTDPANEFECIRADDPTEESDDAGESGSTNDGQEPNAGDAADAVPREDGA